MNLPALRGRTAEVKRAITVLDRTVASGQGALLVVVGGAGIGKSALMSEICNRAAQRGYGIGVGKAEESDQIASMAPLLLALRSGREPLLSQQAFMSLAPMERQQLWQIDRLVDDLETRATTGPVLVCIDDFQWADASTALALRVLPGRLGGSPIVWMITTRPGARAAEDLIQAASRDVTVDTIALTPLSAAAIAQIAQDHLGEPVDDDVIALLGGADGLPFLAVALLEGLAAQQPTERPVKSRTGVAGDELPAALVMGVRTRVEALPVQSVQLVRVGAVLGRTFAVADAAVLLGSPSTDVALPWVEPAVRAGVLDDEGGRLAFRHDLLRQAVYADIPASLRQSMHRAAAQQMLVSGQGAVAAAPHVLRCAIVGDLEAVDLLRQAAKVSDEVTPDTAAELSQRAFALLTPSDAIWSATGLEALRAFNIAGRGGEAMAVADTLLASTTLDEETFAQIQIDVAQAMWSRGELDHMQMRVGTASALRDLTAGTRAHLLALRALSHCRDVDMAAAIADADEAWAAGERSHSAAAQATALQALGEIARNDGRNAAALGFFRRTRPLAGRRFLHDEVVSLQLLDRFDDSAALLREAQHQSDDEGHSSYLPETTFGLMWQAYSLAMLEESDTHARSLIRLEDELNHYTFHNEARMFLCRTAQLRGDYADAREQLRKAAAHDANDDGQQHTLLVVLTWLNQAEDDIAAALEAVHSLVERAHTVRHRWVWQPGWLMSAVDIANQAGERDFAREITGIASTLCEHNPTASNIAIAACATGLTTGDIDALAEAASLCRRSPRPVLRAQITMIFGQALLAAGRTAEGVEHLDRAWDGYNAVGATGDAVKVQHMMQAAGVRRRRWKAADPRPAVGWESLTSGEQRVARLIAEGHTNKSAAEILVLSPNTIATHLRSAFLKLGVKSRVQLALAVAEVS
ncbi:AAA family ATPase [Mycobacterium sp. AZCC_0083]|uniref:ATP-binding protein n=1 Tax=Mycobacterium sp. AZCC_0083 TaxID=2735882 RepID=UPI00160947CA|nr:LuxR family transcriptional regulator [Mycobacterium sp. AZCC_0083]MBB5160745.1 DNA-binding CsgD family transcriptional regulator [Mycobacterium sp. AZCC_0083]